MKQKRRIYDITNVLEGVGLIEKKNKNIIQWRFAIILELFPVSTVSKCFLQLVHIYWLDAWTNGLNSQPTLSLGLVSAPGMRTLVANLRR